MCTSQVSTAWRWLFLKDEAAPILQSKLEINAMGYLWHKIVFPYDSFVNTRSALHMTFSSMNKLQSIYTGTY